MKIPRHKKKSKRLTHTKEKKEEAMGIAFGGAQVLGLADRDFKSAN